MTVSERSEWIVRHKNAWFSMVHRIVLGDNKNLKSNFVIKFITNWIVSAKRDLTNVFFSKFLIF